MTNINTSTYWNQRFKSGDWIEKGGVNQTKMFAESILPFIQLPSNFSGTLLDFGCGLGDAIPIYKNKFPKSQLIGLDFSDFAIELCNQRYQGLATFICGNYLDVPIVDVIIASNVLEHLSNDILIAAELKKRCKELYIVVPYQEVLSQNSEHINTYSKTSFQKLAPTSLKVISSQGWSQFGKALYFDIYCKNIFRIIAGRKVIYRKKQILFLFKQNS